jgi:hypothetical protein
MRRMIAQWMISRSLDGGRDVPAWVRWLSAGDEETLRFEDSARRLADALQHDAPSWRALAPPAGQAERIDRETFGWKGFAPRWAAAAAVGAMLLGGLAWRSRQETAPVQPQIAVVRPTDDAATAREEVDWLLAAFDESQTSFGELLARVDGLMTPREPRKRLGPQVDAAVEFFAYRLPASTAKVAGLSHATATLESPNLLSRFWLGKRGT